MNESAIGMALLRIVGSTVRAAGSIALFFLLTDLDGPGWLQDRPGRRLLVVFGLALAIGVVEEVTRMRRSAAASE